MRKEEKKRQETLQVSIEEEQMLAEAINTVQEEMAATLENFSEVVDPELLEYYTYAYKANEVKHSYLLKRLKRLYYGDKKRLM